MNCRLCGYSYYDRDQQGNTCGHCGGNREGLSRTRLMKISKLIALAAILLPILCYAFDLESTVFMAKKFLGLLEPEELEGHSGAWFPAEMFIMQILISWLFAVPTLFRTKKCSFGWFIAAAAVIFPTALFCLLDNELLPKLAYTLPFFLYIAAAVTAKADKKIQIKEFKIKYPIKKEV